MSKTFLRIGNCIIGCVPRLSRNQDLPMLEPFVECEKWSIGVHGPARSYGLFRLWSDQERLKLANLCFNLEAGADSDTEIANALTDLQHMKETRQLMGNQVLLTPHLD